MARIFSEPKESGMFVFREKVAVSYSRFFYILTLIIFGFSFFLYSYQYEKKCTVFGILDRNDTSIVAKLYIPTINSIESITQAQELRLNLDPYPSQVYGYIKAKIKDINNMPIDKKEIYIDKIAQGNSFAYYYKITAILLDTKNLIFKKGMTFTAEVSLGENSLISWLKH